MSQLSSFLSGLEAQIAEGLVAGALTSSITVGLQTFIAGTPAASLSDAEAYVTGQFATFLQDAITRLPGWEQAIAGVLLSVETANLQSWIDGIVAQVYAKLAPQPATASGDNVTQAGPSAIGTGSVA